MLQLPHPHYQHHHARSTVYVSRRQLLASVPGTHTNSLLASVDLDECISRLSKKELLAESVVEAICAKTKELLMKESNVVHIRAPVTVVGDIHGQFFDMMEIFKIGGPCPDTNYLFLGMYSSAPRGPHATPTCRINID